jgi:hypothetical protein
MTMKPLFMREFSPAVCRNWGLSGGANPIAYAEIYVADGNTPQSVPTGATYTKITPFTNNGLSLNATPDHTNGKITVTKTGKYLVSFFFSSRIGTTSIDLYTAVFINGVEMNNIHSVRFTNAANIASISAAQGFVTVSAGQDVDIRCKHSDGGSVNVTVVFGNLHLQYLGG